MLDRRNLPMRLVARAAIVLEQLAVPRSMEVVEGLRTKLRSRRLAFRFVGAENSGVLLASLVAGADVFVGVGALAADATWLGKQLLRGWNAFLKIGRHQIWIWKCLQASDNICPTHRCDPTTFTRAFLGFVWGAERMPSPLEAGIGSPHHANRF